jgi:tetratricopeptide (TPR) repeat protein
VKRLFASLAVSLALALTIAAGSCTPDSGDEPTTERSVTQLPLPENVVSEELLLPLRQAKNFHHIADVYLQNGKVEQATEAVRSVLSLEFPNNAPEGEDVVLDARARLAKLLVTQGKTDEAMKVVQAGIQSATRDSFFLSNVYTVKGEVHEAIAVGLDETDKAAADGQREEAIKARMKSIEIDRALQKQLMRGQSGGAE